MKGQPRIAIVGAGIGGLTTAIFLRRFGFDVTLYEQAAKLERLGAGIQISPHVTRIFKQIGLFDRMAAVGVVPRERYGRNGYTGEITFTVPVGEFGEKYGASPLAMHRGDLQDCLLYPIPPESIKLGKRLVDLSDGATSCTLTFEDGTSAEADMVIGADGVNSRIRDLLLGPEKPRYSGEVAHRSLFPVELVRDLKAPDITKWWGDDRNILVYFITHSRDTIYFVTGVPQPDWPDEEHLPRRVDNRELLEAFSGFHEDVIRLIEAAPSITAWPVLEKDPLPLWSRGNIVVLGDACHPMKPHMGQGAAMAIEDAVMLARCFKHYDGASAKDIFGLYEAMRRDRATLVQARANASDDWMRFNLGDGKGNAEWLYAYDVLNVPLDARGTGNEREAVSL